MKQEKTYSVTIHGSSPLIMHNSESANPNNEWAVLMNPLKSKSTKNKTESDKKLIEEYSFLSSLYWSDERKGLYIPVDNVRKMILEAGRDCDQKGAKKKVVGIRFSEFLGWELQVKNRDNKEKLKSDPSIKYFKMVTIGKAKVPNTRAKFNEWSFTLTGLVIDLNIIDPKTVFDWIEYAGDRVGLGCRRPKGPTPGEYGRFYITDFKEE